MVDVAGLAVLGTTATLAGATNRRMPEAALTKEKPSHTYNAALYKNALLAPAKAAILFDETPHDDWVRGNATYT
jgi:hypothetical protein